MVYNRRAPSLEGRKFGRLTVVEFEGANKKGQQLWRCRCECGSESVAFRDNLLRGYSASCGCRRSIRTAECKTMHGQSRRSDRTKLYRTWAHAKERVTNPGAPDWARYGGRGITMCSHWAESFETFARDMGEPPSPTHSIDRIDNDKGYLCPACNGGVAQCRWATATVQARNQRSTRLSAGAVAAIRSDADAGLRYADIAAKHGVSAAAIGDAVRGKTWR